MDILHDAARPSSAAVKSFQETTGHANHRSSNPQLGKMVGRFTKSKGPQSSLLEK